MDKWFEDKFEENRIRKHAMKRLRGDNIFERLSRRFSLTNWLIIFNFAVFILLHVLFLIFGSEKVISLIALQANSFFAGNVWTILTSMFAHVEIWHLLANMVSLFFIGNFVEKLIGRKRFFWLYLLSGLFAGLFYVSLSYFLGYGILEKVFLSPDIFAVGASGAIFSLLGILAILTPNNRVYLIAGPIIALIVQSIIVVLFPNASVISILNVLIYIYLIVSIFLIFSFNPKLVKIAVPLEMPFWLLPFVAIVPLIVIGLFVDLPIGNTAHLGGLIVGLFYGYYIKKKYKKKAVLIKKYFSK